MKVFVEAEAEGGAVADRSHGQDKVGCGAESRAQHAKAAGRDAELRDYCSVVREMLYIRRVCRNDCRISSVARVSGPFHSSQGG